LIIVPNVFTQLFDPIQTLVLIYFLHANMKY